ncbi:MAG: hypothetical protein JXN62_09195 [Bacteroidales bacterium]|nr:hypothetical protein [Bacteroidales bacterium]
MLLRVFRGTGPGVFLLIVITLGLFWISAFFDPQLPGSYLYETRPMPLYILVKYLVGAKPWSGVIFSFLILAFLLFLISHFNTSHFFINERTFLPVIIYTVFTGIFPRMQTLNPVLPAALFLMLAQMRIMDSYRKQGTAFNFFDAGILLSIGSLFYANLIFFGIILFVGIAMLRTVSIKEIAISVLGLLTPYIIITGIYYVLGRDIGILMDDIKENLFGSSGAYNFERIIVIMLIYLALILFFSLGYLSTQLNSKKIVSRKTFYLLFWVFGLSLVLYFISPAVSVEIAWLAGIPACYFMANYFVFVKKRILPEVLFTGLYLLALLIQILWIF